MSYNVLMWSLNPTRSLAHSLTRRICHHCWACSTCLTLTTFRQFNIVTRTSALDVGLFRTSLNCCRA